MNCQYTQINTNNLLSDKNTFYYENQLDSGKILSKYNKTNYFLHKNTHSFKNQTQPNNYKTQKEKNGSYIKISLYKKQTYDHFYPPKKYCKNNSLKKIAQKTSTDNNSFIKEFDDEISEIKKTDSIFEETLESNNKKLNLLLDEKNCLKYNNSFSEQKKLKEKIISLNKEIAEKNKIINEFSNLVRESKDKFEQLISKNNSRIAEIELKHKNEINILENKLQNLESENQILKLNNNKLMLIIKKSKKNNNVYNSAQNNNNIRNLKINEANSNLRYKKNLTTTRCTAKTTLLNNQNYSGNIQEIKKSRVYKKMDSYKNNITKNNNLENIINNNIKIIKNIKNISYNNINNSSKRGSSVRSLVNNNDKDISIRFSDESILAKDLFIN